VAVRMADPGLGVILSAQGFGQETPGDRRVLLGRQQEIERRVRGIYGPVKVTPLTFDPHVGRFRPPANNQDKAAVLAVAAALKRRGLLPWIDVKQIPPGRWFQDVIQAGILKVRFTAIFSALVA
jgi:hypothetical protein